MKLAGTLSQIRPFSVLVVGDFMLDTYTTGNVKRISPEAPVPVMQIERHESRAGGTGNVVLNLIALGAKVFICGRCGNDHSGAELKSCLVGPNIVLDGLFEETGYPTPIKNRLIAGSQQLLRMDYEVIRPLPQNIEKEVLAYLEQTISQVQIVALSDYAKGFLSPRLIQSVVALAKAHQIPVIIDPKGTDFSKYRGATLLKPNLSEAFAAARLSSDASLDTVAERIFEMTDVETLLITRSEHGISLFNRSSMRQDFPARSREVKDVTGAGDVVLAVLSAALANGLDIRFAAQLANIAAGIAIERVGCVQVSVSELARRLLDYDSDTKIYDDSHTFALRQVLQDRAYSLLMLDCGQKISSSLFQAIRSIRKADDVELLVSIRDPKPSEELIHFLSSLREVDYVLLHNDPKDLYNTTQPREIFSLIGERLCQSRE